MVEVNLKALIARLNRFCTRSLEGSAGLCISRTNYEITPEHLLCTMADDPTADLQQIFKHFGVDGGRIQKGMLRIIDGLKTGNAGRPRSRRCCWNGSSRPGCWRRSTLASRRSARASSFRRFSRNPTRLGADEYLDLFEGINRLDFKAKYATIISTSQEQSRLMAAGTGDLGGAPAAGPGGPAGDTALAKYADNFTARRAKTRSIRSSAAEREIRQIIDILARRRKNNPIIVGDSGVGKTALVEGLAPASWRAKSRRAQERGRHGARPRPPPGRREREGRVREPARSGSSPR